SVAMLLREHFPVLDTWNVHIIATDLSRDVLNKARIGTYSQLEVNRGLPESMLVRYFDKDGLSWQIRKPIRNMVDFRELNLNGHWRGVSGCDIILMRNVLIYFDIETKKQILHNVRKNLAPNGFFMLGSSESTMKLDDSFTRVAAAKTSCYQTLAVGNGNSTSSF
ncbi:MAG: CheR family methyltransferase, partial [Gemmatimonadaceae bacterium]